MLNFRETMDPCSRLVYRGDKHIGMIMWHSARPPRLDPVQWQYFTLDELAEIYHELARLSKGTT